MRDPSCWDPEVSAVLPPLPAPEVPDSGVSDPEVSMLLGSLQSWGSPPDCGVLLTPGFPSVPGVPPGSWSPCCCGSWHPSSWGALSSNPEDLPIPGVPPTLGVSPPRIPAPPPAAGFPLSPHFGVGSAPYRQPPNPVARRMPVDRYRGTAAFPTPGWHGWHHVWHGVDLDSPPRLRAKVLVSLQRGDAELPPMLFEPHVGHPGAAVPTGLSPSRTVCQRHGGTAVRGSAPCMTQLRSPRASSSGPGGPRGLAAPRLMGRRRLCSPSPLLPPPIQSVARSWLLSRDL